MLKNKIISKSKELGFDLIGFTPYQKLDKETKLLEDWINNSYQAGMEYMKLNLDKKSDPQKFLSDCKSIISLGMNYYVNEEFKDDQKNAKVSRYAWGRDYHNVMWEKLEILINYIKELSPNFKAKSYVDTGPVMDKVWAVKAGLGWQGKHSNIINKNIGSWFFIANIFTNHEFPEYNKEISDFCGTCTACIDACPTDAIVDEYVVDSNKCISYLTIENKSEIPDQFVGKFDNWIIGCDVCQDVCPWNIRFAEETKIADFKKIRYKTVRHDDVENLTNSTFRRKFFESPILRTRLKGLKRNLKFIGRL